MSASNRLIDVKVIDMVEEIVSSIGKLSMCR